MTGRPGYRTMEMIGGSSAPYLARTPCVPLFCTSFNRVGNKERFRLPGAGGGSFPLYGGTFARSYSVSIFVRTISFHLFFVSLEWARPKGHSWATGLSLAVVFFLGSRPCRTFWPQRGFNTWCSSRPFAERSWHKKCISGFRVSKFLMKNALKIQVLRFSKPHKP